MINGLKIWQIVEYNVYRIFAGLYLYNLAICHTTVLHSVYWYMLMLKVKISFGNDQILDYILVVYLRKGLLSYSHQLVCCADV